MFNKGKFIKHQARPSMAVQSHQARKRFGQHFLTDKVVIDKIVRLIRPKNDDFMVEIGPGLGALTKPLLQYLAQLTVVELDRDLIAKLQAVDKLQVIAADVLTVDFRQIAEQAKINKKFRIVGNLPYNISSPILFHLLPFADLVIDQHFMLQKEVVNRMVAKPCTSSYGRLSVMLQWRYYMEDVLLVPPSSFSPPPKVDSAIVRMEPKADFVDLNINFFSELVRVAFSQKRKLIRHSLGKWLEQKFPQHNIDFDLQRRAEEIPTEQYLVLAQQLKLTSK